MRFLILALLLPLVALAEVKFIPADESQPLLRRDLLPLDTDHIDDLSQALAVLADGPLPTAPSQMRWKTQALTLSQRLNPAQPLARSIAQAFAEKIDRPAPSALNLEAAQKQLLDTSAWLTQLPSDSPGHHLALLFLDILHPLNPKHSLLANFDPSASQKRWDKLIPPVTAYQNIPTMPEEDDKTTPEEDDQTIPQYTLTSVSAEILLHTIATAERSRPTAGLVKTTLQLTPLTPSDDNESSKSPHLRFDPATDYELRPILYNLQNFFKTRNSPLPPNFNLTLTTSERRYLERNQENITAPLAMLIDSALTGRPLRPNTYLLAHLQPDGRLGPARDSWPLIKKISQLALPPDSRLILGTGMTESLTAFLIAEDPQFFLKFEVLEAPTYDHARLLFYQDAEPSPDLLTAMETFAEVHAKALEAPNLLTFFTNPYVRTRLDKAATESPQHLSALLLALQANRRPAYHSPATFVQELDLHLEPLSHLRYYEDASSLRDYKIAHDDTRKAIDPLEKRLLRPELNLLKEAVQLLRPLHFIGRDGSNERENHDEIRTRDLRIFREKLAAFREKLRIHGQNSSE